MSSKIIPITSIVDTISETHSFQKQMLYAVNTSDVSAGSFIKPELLPVDKLKGQFKKTFKKDDILFSEIRPANKRYALVNFEDTDDYVASTKLMVLRKKNPEVDLKYFYYYLTADSFLKILQSRAENRICSFPQITYELLGEYSLKCPGLAIQKKISSILEKIDLIIKNNNSIIEKTQKILDEFASLNYFNGDSILQIKNVCKKTRQSLDDYSDCLKTIDLANIDSDTINLRRYSKSTDFTTNLFTIKTNDLYYGSIRPYLHKSGISPFNGAVAGTVFSFECDDFYRPLILGIISSNTFHNYAVANSNGTKMPVADFNALMDFNFKCSEKLLSNYNGILIKLINLCLEKMEENQKLESVRENLRKSLYGFSW